MRIPGDLRLAATVVALLMSPSHASAQEPEWRSDPESTVSKHGEITGILTKRLTKSELEAWPSIMRIVLAYDKDGWRVHTRLLQLYQQTAIGGRNQRVNGFIPFTGQRKKQPRSARDYFERGLARTDAGDSAGAIEDFTNAIALNSNMQAPRRVKHAKSELDNYGKTHPREKYLVIDKFNALAYYNIGNLLMDQGRFSEAVDAFNKAIRLHPRFSHAFNNRGYVKHLMGDIDGATKDFNRSVQLDPQNPNAHFNRCVFRCKINDIAGAIADCSRAIEVNPHLAAAFHERGTAYLAQANLDEAQRDFDRAIELDPGLFVAYGNRGLVRILQGRDAEAEADFAHYLHYAGENKDILERLVQEARESRRANGVKPSGNLPVIAP